MPLLIVFVMAMMAFFLLLALLIVALSVLLHAAAYGAVVWMLWRAGQAGVNHFRHRHERRAMSSHDRARRSWAARLVAMTRQEARERAFGIAAPAPEIAQLHLAVREVLEASQALNAEASQLLGQLATRSNHAGSSPLSTAVVDEARRHLNERDRLLTTTPPPGIQPVAHPAIDQLHHGPEWLLLEDLVELGGDTARWRDEGDGLLALARLTLTRHEATPRTDRDRTDTASPSTDGRQTAGTR